MTTVLRRPWQTDGTASDDPRERLLRARAENVRLGDAATPAMHRQLNECGPLVAWIGRDSDRRPTLAAALRDTVHHMLDRHEQAVRRADAELAERGETAKGLAADELASADRRTARWLQRIEMWQDRALTWSMACLASGDERAGDHTGPELRVVELRATDVVTTTDPTTLLSVAERALLRNGHTDGNGRITDSQTTAIALQCHGATLALAVPTPNGGATIIDLTVDRRTERSETDEVANGALAQAALARIGREHWARTRAAAEPGDSSEEDQR